MLRVGLTGGIGSGKTLVCKIFATLGIPVYNSDDRAKQIMVENTEVVAKIRSLFGKKAYLNDGTVNRKHLSDVAFTNPELLKKLNSIVHPAVYEDTFQWYAKHLSELYVIQEAAILFETGSYKLLDKTILVHAPEELRIQRTMERDKVSRGDVLARMANQMPEAEKLKLADYVIENDGTKSLIEQVMKIDETLKLLASRN